MYQQRDRDTAGQGRVRFGKIVSFVHPEGLYTTSNEKGYNGKDLIECVEIEPRKGLAVKKDADMAKRFVVGPHRCKICEVLPMDENGGVRIKNYWEIQKELTLTQSSQKIKMGGLWPKEKDCPTSLPEPTGSIRSFCNS